MANNRLYIINPITNESLCIAKEYPTKGFKIRPFFHCTSLPTAPHLSNKNRVWCEVEIEDYNEMNRPNSQGGLWFLAKRMKVIRKLS
jgi:hypothetical protein